MNKTLLITGGSSGIGKAIVELALKKQINVIILDKKQPDISSDQMRYFPCDLCNLNELEAIIEVLKQEHINIDYLVNNAAIQFKSPLDSLDFAEWDNVFNVNLRAAVYLIKYISKDMKPGSQILNISSVHGTIPRENKYAYDASKAALNMFSKEAALNLAKLGIKVNVLSLGAAKTPMNDDFKDNSVYQDAVKKIPLGEVADSQAIAKFALYLLLEVDYATGTIFILDGGRSLQ